MAEIFFEYEKDLINEIRDSEAFEDYIKNQRQNKIKRERESWRLILKYKGNHDFHSYFYL